MGQEQQLSVTHDLDKPANQQQVAAAHGGLPISYTDVIMRAMQATNLDPQGFLSKNARRFFESKLLHHSPDKNPFVHLANAERAEDAHDLLRAEAEMTRAIQTADTLNTTKAAHSLEKVRKDEGHETELGQSIREQTSQEFLREQLLVLPIAMRLEAANFYSFHNNQSEADTLRQQAVALAQKLPDSVQRHLYKPTNLR